jgi:acetyl-CoA C-acetyltransferase
MSYDPRAPVLVGAGQIKQEPLRDDSAFGERAEPLELMERAARLAAEDAHCPQLLSRLDSIRVPRGLWPYANPAHTLRERFGVPGAQTALAPISGNMVQRMLTDGARDIAAGRRDAVLVVGAEAEHTSRRAKRAGHELQWSAPDAPGPDLDFETRERFILSEEVEAGLAQPAAIFTLYENARRHAAGESLAANRERIARLWRGFAIVAEGNPFAWTRQAPSVETIRDATPDNRMNSFPYTKRLCSNLVVDLGAAVILCSAELAARLGVPRDRWVFLHTATDCMATPPMSHRMDFLRVPALEIAGRRALELSKVDPNQVSYVDLYSCFPAAVQIAAEALGLSTERPLTLTGGLAYAGGPFNSYVLHAIATAMDKTRSDPGSLALISSIGGAFAKHAFGIYSSDPPERGFQYADLDAEAAEFPRRKLAQSFAGDATIETFVLRYRNGEPSLASVAAVLDDGRRTWAKSDSQELMAEMTERETCGRSATLKDGELIGLGPQPPR